MCPAPENVSYAAAAAARKLVRETGKSLDQLPTLSLNALAGVMSKAAREVSRAGA